MGFFDRFRGGRSALGNVEMLVSVGDHVAGLSYTLPPELADTYIARGYALGALSREYSEDDYTALKGTPQVVSV